ncbi:MAG: serine dehydratase subunit alpha family protein [Atopobiaceae bacterium]|nr:serine dehydratase subunit alpha family protein [Atopobiaceae bacterium]
MKPLRDLILEDMQPALGVTEPAAIALACAKARSLSDEEPESVVVRTNSGIYKNAFTCGIPGTSNVGNDYSAALGLVCGDPDKALLVLEDVDEDAVARAQALIDAGKVTVELDSFSSTLFIGATVKTAHDTCIAEIRGSHTDFHHLEKNGEVLLHKEYGEQDAGESPIKGYRISELIDFARSAPLEDLLFMDAAYELNRSLARAGAEWDRCVVAASLMKRNGGFISDDARLSAKALACAAAEARVLGIDHAAMSITGSGTHGIICTLPLDAYCQVKGIGREELLRATAISYLICMYMKEYSGRLSAFCGCGIAGGTGMACALAYLMGGDDAAIEAVCDNMAASITGMICTGGNHCCCLKVASAIDCAFTCAEIAVDGAGVKAPHGILDPSVEKTLQNVGLIADPGMMSTERTIVGIMQGK